MSKRTTRTAIGPACCALVALGLAFPASAPGARWVIPGGGFGHGVGMSQYGAYGLAKHGRDYRAILAHYYRHTRVGRTGDHPIAVLLASGGGSVGFGRATKACGKPLRRDRSYRFDRSSAGVVLKTAHGRRLKDCGRAGSASGGGSIRIGGHGLYRGRLKAKASGGGLLVINVVHLDAYTKGVVPNEMPASWPRAALRAQAVAARSYALATSGGGSFDVYADARSQVYGGRSSETRRTNRAVARTSRRVVRYGRHIATTYFFSTSGGQTESVQYGFLGAAPVPYLKSVKDPYDGASPVHRWRVRYSQRQMESRLAGLFSGRLRRIRVLRHGDSPRIVRARVVGTRGSSKASGPELQSRLGLRSTWARFHKR